MLLKSKLGGRTLYRTKSLLLPSKAGYVRPGLGKDWFATTTTVWRVDEVMRRRVRDWRRLTGEDGHTGERAETFRKDHDSIYTGTHSVFPAPLMEWALLRYGGPPGGKVLDAFAGGPVRGVVATIMGMEYHGVEIRKEQIDENFTAIKRLGLDFTGCYHECDGRFLDFYPEPEIGKPFFDCAITCPPYFNLEKYSNLGNDLSNLGSYEAFNASMAICAFSHFEVLKPGAFVCIIVGPFRDKKTGELIDFPAHTAANFREAGFIYWQQIVLSKNFASAAKRSTNAWKGHKLVPSHEFMLVFRKPEEKSHATDK